MEIKPPGFEAGRAYYEYVARGYDLIANTYDDVEATNAVGRRLRRKFQEAIRRVFQSGDRVLEIGCGTGIEALMLASRGVEVLATDLSKAMVHRVRAKAASGGLSNLTARRMAAHDVGSLVEEFGESSFDGAYSHAGALNMDPCLSDVATGLGRLLRASARFVCTIVNQISLFEAVMYPLFFKPRKGYRRLGNVIPLPITRLDPLRDYVVPTRFYSPKAFYRHFRTCFTVKDLVGLQILLPPWNPHF